MWETFDQAAMALTRDGWNRFTCYWWNKMISGRKVWLELEWDARGTALIPVLLQDEIE